MNAAANGNRLDLLDFANKLEDYHEPMLYLLLLRFKTPCLYAPRAPAKHTPVFEREQCRF
jgi:hypothetical protein